MQQRNANVINPMQHRAIIAKLKIKLKASYFQKTKKDNCPYDMRKFRENPQKIKKDIDMIKWGKTTLIMHG